MNMKRLLGFALTLALLLGILSPLAVSAHAKEEEVVLRICNWEEYIDLGDWDEEEIIDLDGGEDEEEEEAEEAAEEPAEEEADSPESEEKEDGGEETAATEEEKDDNEEEDGEEGNGADQGRQILGENPMIRDFELWYEATYGVKVRVEYSTFGTNEDLYNMLTIGDVYDLVCPSEYMIMKLMAEDMVQPLSDKFFDENNENNYYIRGVSPYIRNIFETHEINGVTWDKCAAGYMWGVTGFVYNPEKTPKENEEDPWDAETWHLLENKKYERQVTIKDNVRDAYFAAVGALKSDLLTDEKFKSGQAHYEKLTAEEQEAFRALSEEEQAEALKHWYAEDLQAEMNDVSPETVAAAQDYLQDIKDNLYSFETDSGKADIITGKVVANYQWSGDAVYAMDQAEEDGFFLNFAVPEESTNIYFDGWVMLKNGIGNDQAKQDAAEAFINFISRPDNVIRNMYYIGYTSAISGGEDERIFEYLDWNYGAEEDEEETAEYPVGYFFTGNFEDEEYVLTVPAEQMERQLFAQYPSPEVINRASIMLYFDADQNEIINRMWIRVRCYNIGDVPVWAWIVLGAVIAAGAVFFIRRKAMKKKMYE